MLKGNAEGLSTQVGLLFSRVGISPNTWTVLSILPAVAGFVALVYGWLLVGAVLFMVAGFIDMVDGAVARVRGSATNLGAFIDGIMDRYVEILLYMGILVFLERNVVFQLLIPHAYWISLLIFGSFMTSFSKAYADHRKVLSDERIKEMGGLVERAERLLFLYAGMLLGCVNYVFLVYMVGVVAVLANLTALQRIVFAIKNRG